MRAVVRLGFTPSTRQAGEWTGVGVLVLLALVSFAAAFVRFSGVAEPQVVISKQPVIEHHGAPATSPRPASAPIATVARKAAPPKPILVAQTNKLPLNQKIAGIAPPVRDITLGESDRRIGPPEVVQQKPLLAAGGKAKVTPRRDVTLLRDEPACEKWRDAFAKADSPLKDMILAGALMPLARGAEIRILEIRGGLARVQIAGNDRTGWIRTQYLVPER